MQLLGLARWPFLVPELARAYADPASSQATREATTVAFESVHTYFGIGIGECLGYLLTGARTMLVGVAMLQSSAFMAWLAWPGNIIGLLLIVGSLEFVGRFDEQGWKLASAIVPITCIAWSLWLIISGLALGRHRHGRTLDDLEHGPVAQRLGQLDSRGTHRTDGGAHFVRSVAALVHDDHYGIG